MTIENMLEPKNCAINVLPDARDWLATHGLDPLMGARPLVKLVEETIKKPLSKEILFGKLKQGGRVVVSLSNNKLVVDTYALLVDTIIL